MWNNFCVWSLSSSVDLRFKKNHLYYDSSSTSNLLTCGEDMTLTNSSNKGPYVLYFSFHRDWSYYFLLTGRTLPCHYKLKLIPAHTASKVRVCRFVIFIDNFVHSTIYVIWFFFVACKGVCKWWYFCVNL